MTWGTVPPRQPLAIWLQLEDQQGPYCGECGIRWRDPSPSCPHRIRNVHPLVSYSNPRACAQLPPACPVRAQARCPVHMEGVCYA